jgi:hypothetical protein
MIYRLRYKIGAERWFGEERQRRPSTEHDLPDYFQAANNSVNVPSFYPTIESARRARASVWDGKELEIVEFDLIEKGVVV